MGFNIAKTNKKRVVIIGGGFGGVKLANKLKGSNFQVVLIDKNNFHQFPPLLYQDWNRAQSYFLSGRYSRSRKTSISGWRK